jgi:hypothetical protein
MTFSDKEERPVALLVSYHSSAVNVSYVYPWHNKSTRIEYIVIFYICILSYFSSQDRARLSALGLKGSITLEKLLIYYYFGQIRAYANLYGNC